MEKIRKEARLFTYNYSNSEALSSDEFHYLANDFLEIPGDQLQPLLLRMKQNYLSNTSINVEDEFLLLNNLLFYFSLELPEEDFILIAQTLCLMIHSNFKDTKEHRKLFRQYLQYSLQFLESENLNFIFGTLTVISQLASLSKKLCVSILRIIPLQIFFNFIIESIDFIGTDIIYEKIMRSSSSILRNVFYNNDIDRIDSSIIDCLFRYVRTFCELKIIIHLPNFLMCIKDAIARNIPYCFKVIEYGLIPYFNQLLISNIDEEEEESLEDENSHAKIVFLSQNSSDIEYSQLYILEIFRNLLLNKIGKDDIDIFVIYNMIIPGTAFTLPAIKTFTSFLQNFPENSDTFFHLNIIVMIYNIFQYGSFSEKMAAVSITLILLKYSSPENKFEFIQMPSLVDSLFEIVTDVNNNYPIKLIFTIFNMILEIAANFDYVEQIKEIFLDQQNITLLEELANEDKEVGEIATEILSALNDDGDDDN